MNRIHFFTLTILSTVLFALIVSNIWLTRTVGRLQVEAQRTQVELNQAQVIRNNLQQLAARIYQDAQKTQDPGLKDILSRQHINPGPPAANTPDTSVPAAR